MDNKKFLYIGIGVVVVFALVIVALMLTTGSKNKKKTTGDQTLVIWDSTNNTVGLKSIIINFQNEKKVKVDYQVKDQKDYLENAINEIAAGRGPDIWAMPNDWLPKYHNQLISMPNGKMENKKTKKNDVEVYKESYPKSVAFENIIEDKIYGIPLTVEKLSLFINGNVFYQAFEDYRTSHSGESIGNIRTIFDNMPKNWDEFVTASKIITKKDGDNFSVSGTALGTPDNVNNSADILSLIMMQNGAVMTSSDFSTAQFHTAQNQFGNLEYPGTKALEFYTSFANKNSENYTWKADMTDGLHAFAEGKAGMIFGYNKDKAQIKNINSKASITVADVPQIKETQNPINLLRYNSYTVTKSAENPDLAWDFILYITDQSNSTQFVSAMNSQTVNLTPARINDPQVAGSTFSWYNPEPFKTPEIIRTMIKQVNDGTNPQTAIENAASQITDLLGKIKK